MSMRIAKAAVFFIQFSLIGLGIALLFLLFARDHWEPIGPSDGQFSYSRAVQRAAPAVVSIHTATAIKRKRSPMLDDPVFQKFFQLPGAPPISDLETSLGSGVIVDPNGLILTNFHVVRDADRIQTVLSDGRIAEATVVGTDPETDIAVLRIEYADLQSIALGDSNSVMVGDIVLAIGNPLGVGQTVTQGIVSATGRNRVGINTFENFIQTDAAINPGNSGGALVNANGELIGINSAILGVPGIGFAIPTSIAVDVMQQLVTAGTVERGWIGIEARDLTPTLRQELKASSEIGIVVLAVMAGSPAAMAGLLPGDVITHISGNPIRDSQQAIHAISSLRPGSSVMIRATRLGAELDLDSVVAKRPLYISK